jgi:hypothetical protein
VANSVILLNVIYFSLLLFCIIAGCFLWKNLRTKYRIFTLFIVLTLFIEILALVLARRFGSNEKVYQMYDVLNISFITWLQASYLKRHSLKRVVLFVGSALLIVLIVISILGKYGEFSNILTCTNNVGFISFVFVFLLEKMLDPNETHLIKQPEFLFSLFLLFFSSVSVLFWIANTYFTSKDARPLIADMYYIFLSANYLYYIGVVLVFFQDYYINKRINEK